MFKYSFEVLEKTWDLFSSYWDDLLVISPNKKIGNFHESEEKFIINFIKKHNINPKILELGCGTGRCLKVLENNDFNNLVGIDISSKMIIKAKNKLSNTFLLQHDFRERLPFQNNYFDFVLITGNTLTSGGLIESNIVLKQAFRVLKKDGFLIVGSFNAEFMKEDIVNYYKKFPKELRFKKFDNKNKTVYIGALFSHWVTESELKNLIEKAGFKLVSIQKKGIGLIAIAKKL